MNGIIQFHVELFLRNMSGFSSRQGPDRWHPSAVFSPSCGSSPPSPTNPNIDLCLQWKHVGKYYNVLSLSSPQPGAVIGDGQSAVASNIANTTYRLQWWDFTKFDLPEISNGKPGQNLGCWWKEILLQVSQNSEIHVALDFSSFHRKADCHVPTSATLNQQTCTEHRP